MVMMRTPRDPKPLPVDIGDKLRKMAFDQKDVDDDGKLSQKEYLYDKYGVQAIGPKMRFKAADKNDDGALTYDEYKATHPKLGGPLHFGLPSDIEAIEKELSKPLPTLPEKPTFKDKLQSFFRNAFGS